MSISDERLAEILDTANNVASNQIPAIIVDALTELQSLRAAAKVRAIREGGEMQAAICAALLDAYPMADKVADNYAAVAVRAINATQEGK